MSGNLLSQLSDSFDSLGLIIRGGFHLSENGKEKTLYLVGHGGSSFWSAFSASSLINEPNDALDSWTKQAVGQIAKDFEAQAFYPSDGPPYKPFQQWAKKAEDLGQSPIGMLIHPEFGLWHAYRAALVFEGSQSLPDQKVTADICAGCRDKPCLSTCPVEAFSITGYDVPTCINYLKTPAGSDCMSEGCLARRKCPIGQDYIYDPDQAAFHMRAFKAAH